MTTLNYELYDWRNCDFFLDITVSYSLLAELSANEKLWIRITNLYWGLLKGFAQINDVFSINLQ